MREQNGAALLHEDAFTTAAMSRGNDAESAKLLPPSSSILSRIALANGRPATTEVALAVDTEQERGWPWGTKKGEDTADRTFEALVWKMSTAAPMDSIAMCSKDASPFIQ